MKRAPRSPAFQKARVEACVAGTSFIRRRLLNVPVRRCRRRRCSMRPGVIVAPTAPSAVLREFEVVSAGTYELTLTDFAVPGAMSENGPRLCAMVSSCARSSSATSPAPASLSMPPRAAYALSIVATPGAAGIGTIGARVRRGTDSPVVEFTATISVPNPPPADTHQVLDTTFTVSDAGQYRVIARVIWLFRRRSPAVQLAVVPEGGAPVGDARCGRPGLIQRGPWQSSTVRDRRRRCDRRCRCVLRRSAQHRRWHAYLPAHAAGRSREPSSAAGCCPLARTS